MDPRLGTETPGPGEAVCSQIQRKTSNVKFQNPIKNWEHPNHPFQDPFGGRIVYELCEQLINLDRWLFVYVF